MGNYLHLKFHDVSKEKQEILIAQLSELGVDGFEEGDQYLSAFIAEEQYDEAAFNDLIAGENFVVEKEIIPPKNWNEEWEKSFEPVVIDNFCAVRAHFHAPVSGVKYEIIITPKMSFGTGHHATTYLMIKGMESLDFKGKSVLDFGTGTGILGILSEKAGAQRVMAIDNDDWSIANANENKAINGCSAITTEIAEISQIRGPFDVILANINKHVLLANMALVAQHLDRGGVVLLSGILTGDRQDIENEALKNKLSITEQQELKGWICVLLERQLE